VALGLYPVADYDSNAWAAVAMFSDAIYTCPTRRLALAAAPHAPTYRYLYTHVMQNDPDQAAVRAAHTFEDTFLWHHFYSLESGDPYSPTLAEEQLSATMSSYWTNFAKRGDPNGPGLPAWPLYEPEAERYLVLDDVVRVDAAYHIPQCALMDSAAALFPTCTSLCHYYETAQWWHRFDD
jgi:para-nitrobenzyl esterase